jgi:hypothetical protein
MPILWREPSNKGTIEMSEQCNWVEDNNGFWVTGCGNLFDISEGTPSDNKMHCGKRLQEVQTDDRRLK